MKNFKATTTLLILTFPTLLVAGECYDAAKKFGTSHKDLLPGECIEKTIRYARGNQKHVSESGNFMSVGYANVLIARRFAPLRDNIIAGPSTRLENIAATAIDEKNNEVFALDSSKNTIFAFNAELPGNVAPKRYFKSDALAGAVAIAVDASRGLLIVTSPKSVSIYNRQAYSEGRRPEHSTKPISLLDENGLGAGRITEAAYRSSSGQLDLTDSEKNQIISVRVSADGHILSAGPR